MSTATKLSAFFAGVLLGSLTTFGLSPARSGPPETREPPAIRQPDPPRDAGDLFEQLRERIDRRIDEKLVAGLEDASAVQAGAKTSVVGGLVLAALTKIVAGLLRAMLEALIFGAVVALLWKYGWYLVLGLASVATLVSGPVGWLAGRRAASRGA